MGFLHLQFQQTALLCSSSFPPLSSSTPPSLVTGVHGCFPVPNTQSTLRDAEMNECPSFYCSSTTRLIDAFSYFSLFTNDAVGSSSEQNVRAVCVRPSQQLNCKGSLCDMLKPVSYRKSVGLNLLHSLELSSHRMLMSSAFLILSGCFRQVLLTRILTDTWCSQAFSLRPNCWV